MKIYVDDKLPRSCDECNFYCTDEYCQEFCYALTDEYKEEFDVEDYSTWGGESDDINRRRACFCPLQSLDDYTKQVRKEVIAKVYEVLEQAVPHSLCWSWAVIKKELDKIEQGETK